MGGATVTINGQTLGNINYPADTPQLDIEIIDDRGAGIVSINLIAGYAEFLPAVSSPPDGPSIAILREGNTLHYLWAQLPSGANSSTVYIDVHGRTYPAHQLTLKWHLDLPVFIRKGN